MKKLIDTGAPFLRMAGALLLLVLSAQGRAQQPPERAELDCLVKPEIYVDLSTSVDSVLEEVLVDIGDTVTTNQSVARLESSVERARLQLAELQAKSQWEIANRREQLRYAEKNLTRINDLLLKQSVSQFESDKAQTEVALARIELEKARENRLIARLNLDLARSELALKNIRSPIDGVVVDRYAVAGESVAGRTIMKLAKIDPLKIELIAPTELFGRIEKGMQVEIWPEQPADQSFVATVSTVDQLIDPASGSFTVRMSLPNPDNQLVGGVNCVALFDFTAPLPVSGEEYSALAIPGEEP